MAKRQKWKKPAGAPKREVAKSAGTQLKPTKGYPAFRFDMMDRDGIYAFNLSRKDFNHELVLGKIVEYSCMKWTDIMMQTHDRTNKSKHHYLSDAGRLSPEAKERLRKMQQEDNTDALFSFALLNKIRLIGFREGDDFHVLWYDANHGVYPSKK